MQQAVVQVLAEPAVQARMAGQGADIVAGTPEQAATFLAAEVAKWGQVISDNDIRADS